MTSPHDPQQFGQPESESAFNDDFAAAFGLPATTPPAPEGAAGSVDLADLQGLLDSLGDSVAAPDVDSLRADTADELIPIERSYFADENPVQLSRGLKASSIAINAAAVTGAKRIDGARLMFKGNLDAEVDLKSTLALRLDVAAEAQFYELRVGSDIPVLPETVSGQCTFGLQDIGSIRFVPKVAGQDELRFELILLNSMRIPVSRQTGSVLVHVSNSQNQSIHAGGDVIIFGGRSAGRGNAGHSGALDEKYHWHDVPLLEDSSFRIRAENHRPHPIRNRPADFNEALVPIQTNGLLYCSVEKAKPVCFGIAFGTETSLGRGGDEDVNWWIRPGHGQQDAFGKISRKHISVFLKNNYAWVCSMGSNGTSLNGRLIVKGSHEMLAHGDRITLAGEMSFSVRLFSDEQRVASIELCREDGLRELSSIVLSLPGSPHPLLTDTQLFWIACTETKDLRLKLDAGDWQNAPEGAECVLGDSLKLAWYDFGGAVDQDQVF